MIAKTKVYYAVFDRGSEMERSCCKYLGEGLQELERAKTTWPHMADTYDLRKITTTEEIISGVNIEESIARRTK